MRRLAIIAGGRSPAREISLASARALLGELVGSPSFQAELVEVDAETSRLDLDYLRRFDALLPLVHGAQGAHLLGMLALTDRSILLDGEGLALDKPMAKRLMHEAGLPVLPGKVLTRREIASREVEALKEEIRRSLSFPCVVKPAGGVAAVGCSLVWEESELPAALARAAAFDSRVLLEPWLDAREIEVEVVAGEATRPGEMVFRGEILDHATRKDESRIELFAGALAEPWRQRQMVELGRSAAQALGIEGVARVELFLDRNGRGLYVNEVNAMPSFLPGSVFRRLWELEGVPVETLLSRLVNLAEGRMAELSQTQWTQWTPARPLYARTG